MIKGFALDDERLKQGKTAFGKDYFHELLERVRSIRASERRIWQQVTDIFAECSIDYDKDAEIPHAFYSGFVKVLENLGQLFRSLRIYFMSGFINCH